MGTITTEVSTVSVMQRAYHVLSTGVRELVDANIFDHRDYGGIFQCPHCDQTLTLQSGYKRNGSWVDATFAHPEGKPTDCYLRVSATSGIVTNMSTHSEQRTKQ